LAKQNINIKKNLFMKKLQKLKLTKISKTDLELRAQQELLGGRYDCSCGCVFSGQPYGSLTNDFKNANISEDLTTPGYYDVCDAWLFDWMTVTWQ
jgi:natural product precursor